jgi:hypothetical protein
VEKNWNIKFWKIVEWLGRTTLLDVAPTSFQLDCATTPHLAVNVNQGYKDKCLLKFSLIILQFFEIFPFSILSRVQIMLQFFFFPIFFAFQTIFYSKSYSDCLISFIVCWSFVSMFICYQCFPHYQCYHYHWFFPLCIRPPDLWLVCLSSFLRFNLPQALVIYVI